MISELSYQQHKFWKTKIVDLFDERGGSTMHHKTKHMDIRYHCIRECTIPLPGESQPRARIQYHPTNHMTAGVLTKALGRKLSERHALVLMGHAVATGLEVPLY